MEDFESMYKKLDQLDNIKKDSLGFKGRVAVKSVMKFAQNPSLQPFR